MDDVIASCLSRGALKNFERHRIVACGHQHKRPPAGFGDGAAAFTRRACADAHNVGATLCVCLLRTFSHTVTRSWHHRVNDIARHISKTSEWWRLSVTRLSVIWR